MEQRAPTNPKQIKYMKKKLDKLNKKLRHSKMKNDGLIHKRNSLRREIEELKKGTRQVPIKCRQSLIELSKGVHTDKELDTLKGFEKVGISHREYGGVNKLEHVTEMTINLDELDNTDNLKDGRPIDAGVLFTYYVPAVKDFIHFEPYTPQYKKLKNGMITSLTLRITDQNNSVITNGPGTTVVLHIR